MNWERTLSANSAGFAELDEEIYLKQAKWTAEGKAYQNVIEINVGANNSVFGKKKYLQMKQIYNFTQIILHYKLQKLIIFIYIALRYIKIKNNIFHMVSETRNG